MPGPQVSGLKSRLGLFPDENGIPIYRTFDFEQDLPANSLVSGAAGAK